MDIIAPLVLATGTETLFVSGQIESDGSLLCTLQNNMQKANQVSVRMTRDSATFLINYLRVNFKVHDRWGNSRSKLDKIDGYKLIDHLIGVFGL